jgi:hypothetical protein
MSPTSYADALPSTTMVPASVQELLGMARRSSRKRLDFLLMTVFVYVNTGKQVGDPEPIKAFATADAAATWFEENDSEGVASSTR